VSAFAAAGYFRYCGRWWRQNVCGNLGQGQHVEMFGLRQTHCECRTGVLITVPVRQTGMMAGDQIGDDTSGGATPIHGIDGACG
jgi:hypothetical protein